MTPKHATRTNARPDAGRMLVRVNAVFTIVPGDVDEVEICAAETASWT